MGKDGVHVVHAQRCVTMSRTTQPVAICASVLARLPIVHGSSAGVCLWFYHCHNCHTTMVMRKDGQINCLC